MSIDKVGMSFTALKSQKNEGKKASGKQEFQVPELTPEAKEKIKTTKDNLIANYTPEIAGTGLGVVGAGIAAHRVGKVTKPIIKTLQDAKNIAVEYAKHMDSAEAGGVSKELFTSLKKQFEKAGYSYTKFTEDTFNKLSKNVNKYQKIALGACALLIPVGYAIGNIVGKIINSNKNKEEAETTAQV